MCMGKLQPAGITTVERPRGWYSITRASSHGRSRSQEGLQEDQILVGLGLP